MAEGTKTYPDPFRAGRPPRSARAWARPLAAAAAVLLGACAPLDFARFDDAARRAADRGIGAGGEGRPAGAVGIVGTVTGLNSVLVNGLAVAVDPETAVTEDGVLTARSALRAGQVVAVEAVARRGGLAARSIAITHAVSGPITAVEPSGTRIEVLGQTVALDPAAPETPAPDALRVGRWVTVSGLRDARGAIVASRVASRAARGRVSVRGPVTARAAEGFAIGRTGVVFPALAAAVEPGRTVLAVGALTSAGLRAARVEPAPAVPFDGRVSRVSIEGFVGGREGARVAVSGIRVWVTGATVLRGKPDDRLSIGDRVTVEAVVVDGGTVAETIDAARPAGPRAPRP